MHEPAFLPITFEVDIAAGTGRVSVPGIIATDAEPISNPITGEAHRAQVELPGGFEYRLAEFVRGATRATGPVPLEWSGRHNHLATLNLSTHGAA